MKYIRRKQHSFKFMSEIKINSATSWCLFFIYDLALFSPVLCCVWMPVGSWYQLLGPLQFEVLCRFSMVNFSYMLRASRPPCRELRECGSVRVHPCLPSPFASSAPPSEPPKPFSWREGGWVGGETSRRRGRRGRGGVHIA